MQIPPHWLPATRLLLLFAIFASAGPEIFAALEMATLLEVLGTALFLTAIGAGVRLIAIEAGRWLRNFFVPPAVAGMFRHGGTFTRANVVAYLSGRAVFCLLHVMVIGMFGLHLWRA